MTLTRDPATFSTPYTPAPYTGTPFNFGIELASVICNQRHRFDGTEPVIIAMHGHGGSGLTFGVPNLDFAHQLTEFARAGYIVVSIDAGGAAGWPSPIVDGIITNAIAWATSPGGSGGLGGKAGKVGLYGYSMGGGNAISYAKNHPAAVAFVLVFAPAINLDVFMPEPEIDILYASAWATKTGGTQTLTTTPVDLLVVSAATIIASGYTSGFGYRLNSAGAVSFHYTGVDATHLLGCTVSSGSLAVANNNLLIVPYGAYTGHEGYNAHYDATIGQYSPGSYTVPTRLTHGSADLTVVPSTIAAFLASANNPGIEERLLVGADHTNLFRYLPSDLDVAWAAAYLG